MPDASLAMLVPLHCPDARFGVTPKSINYRHVSKDGLPCKLSFNFVILTSTSNRCILPVRNFLMYLFCNSSESKTLKKKLVEIYLHKFQGNLSWNRRVGMA